MAPRLRMLIPGRREGRGHWTQSHVTLIGLSLLAGDRVTVLDHGVLVQQSELFGGNILLIRTTSRERAQELYDLALADAEDATGC